MRCINSRIIFILIFFSACALPRYKRIHNEAFLADTHNDLLSSVTLQGMNIENDLKGKTHSDLGRLKKGGVDLQIFSIFCDEKYGNGTAFNQAIREIDSINAIAARNPDRLKMIRHFSEIDSNANYIQGLTGVEGGHMIEDDLSKIDSFHNRGVSYLTLTWNNSTSWASSAKDETNDSLAKLNKGLNAFGKEVVRKLNSYGMMVDVSHVGEQTFRDVINTTTKPIIASHSSVYAICPVFRNLKDDQIRAIAKNGGVIHINLYSGFLDSNYRKKVALFVEKHRAERDALAAQKLATYEITDALFKKYPGDVQALRPDISVVIDHINYIVKLVGIDHVGIGSDFDGIESTPKGLDGVEDFPKLTRALLKAGYNIEDVGKILGGNFLRVFKQQ